MLFESHSSHAGEHDNHDNLHKRHAARVLLSLDKKRDIKLKFKVLSHIINIYINIHIYVCVCVCVCVL